MFDNITSSRDLEQVVEELGTLDTGELEELYQKYDRRAHEAGRIRNWFLADIYYDICSAIQAELNRTTYIGVVVCDNGCCFIQYIRESLLESWKDENPSGRIFKFGRDEDAPGWIDGYIAKMGYESGHYGVDHFGEWITVY